MNVRQVVAMVAAAEDGLVEWTRLLSAGLTKDQALGAVRGMRAMHDGVWLTGHGRIRPEQRWRAATLTAPATVLTHASAGACWAFWPWEGPFEVVTRPGSGGPKRIGDLLVCRSTTLGGHATTRDGIPVTSPARTVVDLAAHLTPPSSAKAVREALRLKVVTALELQLCIAEHAGRRGTRTLRAIVARYERLPIHRTRSDAEARALEVLAAAPVEPANLNRRIAGEEADLSWPRQRLIVEIDGPQWHLDPVEDARKEAAWREAGWIVRRISSDTVFDEPERLVALAPRSPAL